MRFVRRRVVMNVRMMNLDRGRVMMRRLTVYMMCECRRVWMVRRSLRVSMVALGRRRVMLAGRAVRVVLGSVAVRLMIDRIVRVMLGRGIML
jgi:hypothetical protein